jgi:hypothetical protein
MRAAADTFIARTRDWKSAIDDDEWLFARLRDDIVAGMSTGEAFESIDPLVNTLLELECDVLLIEGIFLLEAVVTRSQTTQIPTGLEDRWPQLIERARAADRGREVLETLTRWYRRCH